MQFMSDLKACGVLLMAASAATLVLAGGPELQPKMGDPLPGLTPAQQAAFDVGQAAFASTPLYAGRK